jgi:hypothetical protein
MEAATSRSGQLNLGRGQASSKGVSVRVSVNRGVPVVLCRLVSVRVERKSLEMM